VYDRVIKIEQCINNFLFFGGTKLLLRPTTKKGVSHRLFRGDSFFSVRVCELREQRPPRAVVRVEGGEIVSAFFAVLGPPFLHVPIHRFQFRDKRVQLIRRPQPGNRELRWGVNEKGQSRVLLYIAMDGHTVTSFGKTRHLCCM
jgi:hypothetical protein